ncbi:uncharacterized protein Dsimw501_GD29383 [Drosophila simulans]|nr:uncharacterized protein Dsimw501_GD29383 [Drosophila simulans]
MIGIRTRSRITKLPPAGYGPSEMPGSGAQLVKKKQIFSYDSLESTTPSIVPKKAGRSSDRVHLGTRCP